MNPPRREIVQVTWVQSWQPVPERRRRAPSQGTIMMGILAGFRDLIANHHQSYPSLQIVKTANTHVMYWIGAGVKLLDTIKNNTFFFFTTPDFDRRRGSLTRHMLEFLPIPECRRCSSTLNIIFFRLEVTPQISLTTPAYRLRHGG